MTCVFWTRPHVYVCVSVYVFVSVRVRPLARVCVGECLRKKSK